MTTVQGTLVESSGETAKLYYTKPDETLFVSQIINLII